MAVTPSASATSASRYERKSVSQSRRTSKRPDDRRQETRTGINKYKNSPLSSVERMTVSVGVPVALVRGDVYYWGSLMAACLITSMPLAIVYNFFLDRFIAGFTIGAIK